MDKKKNIYYYYMELQELLDELRNKTELYHKFLRRREQAKHSAFNNDGFISLITEGEDINLKLLQKATERKEFFDKFNVCEWENNTIFLEDNMDTLNILEWCMKELNYKPYTKYVDIKKILYIFHNQEDAVAVKLRWT